VLAEVRKAKSVEKRSLRTEVRRLVVEDIAEQLEALRAAETDLCQAGVVLDLELRDAGERSVTIAKAGIYDLRLHHDEVVAPILRMWKVFDRDDLSGDGARARDELGEFMAGLDAQASRFVEQRERLRERQAARAAG